MKERPYNNFVFGEDLIFPVPALQIGCIYKRSHGLAVNSHWMGHFAKPSKYFKVPFDQH